MQGGDILDGLTKTPARPLVISEVVIMPSCEAAFLLLEAMITPNSGDLKQSYRTPPTPLVLTSSSRLP